MSLAAGGGGCAALPVPGDSQLLPITSEGKFGKSSIPSVA